MRVANNSTTVKRIRKSDARRIKNERSDAGRTATKAAGSASATLQSHIRDPTALLMAINTQDITTPSDGAEM